MKDENKKKFLDWAEIIDAFRVIPRVFISVYIYLMFQSVMWFMTLDNPTNAQATLISVMAGVGAAWFAAYVNTGRKS